MKKFSSLLLLMVPTFAGGIACGWWLKPPVPSDRAPAIRPTASLSKAQGPGSGTGKAESPSQSLDWSQQTSDQRKATIAQILRLPHPDQRLAEFITRLKTFDSDDVINAIAMIKAGDRQGMSFAQEWVMLVEHWGRIAGAKALGGSFEEFGGNASNVDWFRKSAIGGWAEQDPMAAVAWLDARPDQNDWLGCFVALSNGIGRTDPDLAAAILTGSLNPADTKATWARNESLKNLVVGIRV
jgi:hypothetical protein